MNFQYFRTIRKLPNAMSWLIAAGYWFALVLVAPNPAHALETDVSTPFEFAQSTSKEEDDEEGGEAEVESDTDTTDDTSNDTTGDSAPTNDENLDDAKAPLDPDFKVPEIITDLTSVPFPVRKMRELILDAARTGDVEKLRPYIGYGDDVTMLSLGGFDEDPIDFLKSLSGDKEGHEILAIMTEILEAPFVKIEEGNGEEVYVWPYYFSYPFDKLTPEQRVRLFRIITYGDYEEMIQFGTYLFYRLGITPEGRWRFFVAGD